MNRSITNVLFGGMGTAAAVDHKIEGAVTTTTVDETADALSNADSVILVITWLFREKAPILTTLLRSWDMGWLLPKRNMPYLKYAPYFGSRA